ncbi:nuclear transport factor 2 family protein [Phycisphaerales bacterium AB-hyl4]|uniref:Nuclear transport factor 2 family protein n=1 Tax=Natronomicrosphaera hydrolytica TaxID=3242702 RepID=A0ABV4U080_9BACT
MADELTQRFIDALHSVEQQQDMETMTSLFSEDAELINAARNFKPQGQEGARQFWQQYRSAFDTIYSEFTSVKEGDGFAVLEWHGSGTRQNGQPLEYDGVSVIEHDGGHIRRFATYYDSSVFVGASEQGASGTKGGGSSS